MKLDELGARAGIAPRTVRYYVQRGLLPPPTFKGKDSSYGASHLLRLKVIKALQAAFYPLEEIKVLLATKDDPALQALLLAPPAPLLAARVEPAARIPSPAVAPPGRMPARAPPGFPDESPWRKIVLAPGVELLVREGADDARVRRVVSMFDEEELP